MQSVRKDTCYKKDVAKGAKASILKAGDESCDKVSANTLALAQWHATDKGWTVLLSLDIKDAIPHILKWSLSQRSEPTFLDKSRNSDDGLQRVISTEVKVSLAIKRTKSYLTINSFQLFISNIYSRSSQCSTTGVTKAVVYAILFVLLLIGKSSPYGGSGFPL